MTPPDLSPFDPARLEAIAERWDTPCYVYHEGLLRNTFQAFSSALEGRPHRLCYAVKANSSLAILSLFARMGAGFDIVSGGELQRVLAAGGDAGSVVFSGVGKRADEIRLALQAGILFFNVESEAELLRIDRIANEMGLRAPVSLRVNPDVDAGTHPYISTGLKTSKFGIAYDDALRLYQRAASLSGVRVVGIDCHIGSQITEITPFIDALDRILLLVDMLTSVGIMLHHIDLGGGLGIRYHDESPPAIGDYVHAIRSRLDGRPQHVLLEPGRALVGNAGLLLTRVEYLKAGEERNFAIVDAAMNDLMRPALYDAWHEIVPVRPRTAGRINWEVVGPGCETGDFIGHERALALQEGDLLAILSAGAYGMSMSSNYNSRPRAAEVLLRDNGENWLMRERERITMLYANEHIPD